MNIWPWPKTKNECLSLDFAKTQPAFITKTWKLFNGGFGHTSICPCGVCVVSFSMCECVCPCMPMSETTNLYAHPNSTHTEWPEPGWPFIQMRVSKIIEMDTGSISLQCSLTHSLLQTVSTLWVNMILVMLMEDTCHSGFAACMIGQTRVQ